MNWKTGQQSKNRKERSGDRIGRKLMLLERTGPVTLLKVLNAVLLAMGVVSWTFVVWTLIRKRKVL